MSDSTDFSDRQLEIIGQYVKRNLRDWIQETGTDELYGGTRADPALFERAVAVEKELKAQRELMKQGFDQMEKRFEQVDKRFEQIDKRFEQVDTRFEEMRSDTNQRFADMRSDMEKRFAQVDKRFEETRSDMNQRFSMMMRFMSIGFVALALLMSVYEFIR
jgi:ABC-type phosphate transport system auxiliary subunit